MTVTRDPLERALRGNDLETSCELPRRVPMQRVAYIDNAKAIGIVLVVLGHAPGTPSTLNTVIWSFHMPLFFFLSGLLLSEKQRQMPVATRLASLARSLLLPYLFFFVVSYLYWLIAKRHGVQAEAFERMSLWQPLSGFYLGTGDALFVNVVLWFFPALFIVSASYHLLSRFLGSAIVTISCIGAGSIFVLLHAGSWPRWPLSADCALAALPFYAIGVALRDQSARTLDQPVKNVLVPFAIALAVLLIAVAFVQGQPDLNKLSFGRHPVLYLPAGLIGIVIVLIVSAMLPRSSVARWLSENTLTIFPLHFLMFSVFTGIALKGFAMPISFKESPLTALVYTVSALLLSWPAAWLLHRVVPWLFTNRQIHQVGQTHPGDTATAHR